MYFGEMPEHCRKAVSAIEAGDGRSLEWAMDDFLRIFPQRAFRTEKVFGTLIHSMLLFTRGRDARPREMLGGYRANLLLDPKLAFEHGYLFGFRRCESADLLDRTAAEEMERLLLQFPSGERWRYLVSVSFCGREVRAMIREVSPDRPA